MELNWLEGYRGKHQPPRRGTPSEIIFAGYLAVAAFWLTYLLLRLP